MPKRQNGTGAKASKENSPTVSLNDNINDQVSSLEDEVKFPNKATDATDNDVHSLPPGSPITSEGFQTNTNGSNGIQSSQEGSSSNTAEMPALELSDVASSNGESVENHNHGVESRETSPLSNGHHKGSIEHLSNKKPIIRSPDTQQRDTRSSHPSADSAAARSATSSPATVPSSPMSHRCLSPASSAVHPYFMASPSPRHRNISTSSTTSNTGEVSVPMFFTGKGVFVTGATGFIGKVLIEKLLRSCPDIACVYCLIRPKNKQAIDKRLEEITSSKLFDRLRKERPNFASQLRPVNGDVIQPGLGISDTDRQMLERNVNVVFHSAATVRFDEPLRVAVEMNVLAVRKMLALCRNFHHLESFVHVSTAYANCDRPYIEETVYPPPVEPQKIIDVLEWMDDEMLEVFTPKLLGEKPNTYTYTKQLAENILLTEGTDLPIAIIRPSIVGAAWKEPFPGWIDNYNGPSGIYIAAGRGILRSMKGDYNAVADIVPVDIPVNIMITVAWYTAVAKPKSVMIYHATTGGRNPFTWGDMSGIINKSFHQMPLEGCFRRPNVAIVGNNYLHDYWTCVSHLFPAYLCDAGFRLMGKKPRMVKLYNKLHRSIDCLKFFTCNEWEWANSNHDMLKHQLQPADLKTFYFDPLPLHWPTYIENYCLGAKKYVLNEDLSGLPAARAHMRKLRIIRYVFNSMIAVILWRVLIAKSQFARNLWFFIVGLVYKFVQHFRITSTMNKS